jgi:CBS domain-containing protein
MSVRVSIILARKGSDVVTIARDATVTEALRVLAEHNVGALIVSADGKAVDGIVSERDVVRWLARAGPDALHYPVEQVMTTDVLACRPDATADDVMQTMTTHRARHLPVLDDDGRLTGVVSIGDVVKSRIDDLVTQARSMEDYISGSPL